MLGFSNLRRNHELRHMSRKGSKLLDGTSFAGLK
jgi:hypothetical protein